MYIRLSMATMMPNAMYNGARVLRTVRGLGLGVDEERSSRGKRMGKPAEVTMVCIHLLLPPWLK